MHSPPSYQTPLAEVSLNTTSNEPPSLSNNPVSETHESAKQAVYNYPIKEKANPAPNKINTKHTACPTNPSHSLNHTATQFTDSLALLRDNQKAKISELINTQKDTFLSVLSDLALAHKIRTEELTSINTDLLDFDLSDTTLEFKDATGQDKGSATLGERMNFFETRVNDIQTLIERIVSEREKVEMEIGIVGSELQAVLADGTEGVMEEQAEECRMRIERVVDDAVKAWDLQESRYEKEKALHREGLSKLCGEGELEGPD